jgi:lipopolysaccharide transport system permease protein
MPNHSIQTRELLHFRDLVLVLLAKELKVRYKNTLLGYAWSVLNPLVFALVLFFAFKVIIKIQLENYLLFLITGLFPWQWFQNSINAANGYFLGNASLLKRVYFPRSVLVLTAVLNDMVHFLASLVVIVLLMAYYGIWPRASWLWLLPLLLGTQFMLTYGLALIVATANLFFRDLERLTTIFTMLWFYLTPVTFAATMIPERFQWTCYVNPMAGLVLCWRDLFLHGSMHWDYLGAAAGMSLLALALGMATYQWKKRRFAEIV